MIISKLVGDLLIQVTNSQTRIEIAVKESN
jgi:hypothetical protein